MQIHRSVGIVGNQLATGLDNTHSWDFVSPNQDEVLALLKPGSDRKRTIVLVGCALVAGLGLGWTCGANIATFNSITQTETETPSHRVSEVKSSKSDGARRTASPSGPQTPKPEVASPGGPRFALDPASTQAATPPIAREPSAREPMVPVAETRPTTIEGWTVLDVRGGTAVLEGPDGVRTAARGDTVPGIGRIDSIVRWGNRWIVATANGLIATP